MESSLRKLQKIEADILQVVSKICDEEQIDIIYPAEPY